MLQVTIVQVLRELFARNLLLQHVKQMHRVSRDLGLIEIEYPRQNLEGEPGGKTLHTFIDAGIIAILLVRLGLGIGILEAFAVVHPHLRINARIFRDHQAGQYAELRQHLECARRTGSLGQRAVG